MTVADQAKNMTPVIMKRAELTLRRVAFFSGEMLL